MALSAAWRRIALAVLLCAAQIATCDTITYDFDISWVQAAPDGFSRPVIGVNGAWPPPAIEAQLGDTIVVNVVNSLGNQSTALHFHGMFMNGTSDQDGPAQVTQYPIAPGANFTYRFKASQAGLYWYHSHFQGQYPDGLRAALIVRDPEHPYRGQYDEEVVLSLSDWYHTQMADLIPHYLNDGGMMSQEPVPDANLLNDTQNLRIPVATGKTYLVRLVNMGAFAGQYFWIEGHTMKIVEVDGVYTKPAETAMLYLSSGQRCSFLLSTEQSRNGNYPLVASMDPGLSTIRKSANQNVTGWLVYEPTKSLPQPKQIDNYDPVDDKILEPYDEMPLLPEPDQRIILSMEMSHKGGIKWFFNSTRYSAPEIPTIYTALTSGVSATDPSIYGQSTNPFVLKHQSIVELIIYNRHMVRHPFHLHGHNFQVVHRSAANSVGKGNSYANGINEDDFPRTPIRRDTALLENGGLMILRFRADNPGVWLFHCHMEWHVETGLVTTMIEAPLELQRQHEGRPLPATSSGACCAHDDGGDEEQEHKTVPDGQHETTPATQGTAKKDDTSSMISMAVLIAVILITAALAGLAFLARSHLLLLTERRPEQRKRGDTVAIEANASVEQERPLLGDPASRESIELSEGSSNAATPLPADPGQPTPR